MKYLKAKLKWEEYKAYPDKIIFQSKCSSNGMIKLSKTLKQFAKFDFLYVKINGKLRKFTITTGKDRGNLIYRCYIGRSNRNRKFQVFLKTISRFRGILIKSLGSKKDILDNYENPNFRIKISDDRILLLRFLLNLSSKSKHIPRIVSGDTIQKSITLETYKNMIRENNVNSKIISPFLSNRYIDEIEYNFTKDMVDVANPEIYRLVGLINGDGTLTKYGAYFYGNEKVLHNDFERISLNLDRNLQIKKSKVLKTYKTYWYSVTASKQLNKIGTIYNRKLDFITGFELPFNLNVYSEYLSGFYDAEGTFIKDSHIILPTSVTVSNKNINILTKRETKYLLNLAKEEGRFKYFIDTDSKSYGLGLNKLNKSKKRKEILIKLNRHFPGLMLSNKKILDNLSISSKMELKYISVYPLSENITAHWWLKITSIKDVIKFSVIINPTLIEKQKKLNDFVFNHITTDEFKKIGELINKNGS